MTVNYGSWDMNSHRGQVSENTNTPEIPESVILSNIRWTTYR